MDNSNGVGRQPIYLGCAGWSVGREHAAAFPEHGTHLQRYAWQFNGVEINSSFYRPHRQQTYARWADSVPHDLRFSVKVPKRITHELHLVDCDQALAEFLTQCSGLGDRLGCLLVQLPPSLVFEEHVAHRFFRGLRAQYSGAVVLEPRHPSWTRAEPLLMAYAIAQAVVDPSRIATDSSPRGSRDIAYWRLHGSPRIYFSPYDQLFLERLASLLERTAVDRCVWCIFDNTASGAALKNALALKGLLTKSICTPIARSSSS
ncbi:DUF72 domain-containing protein [Pseudomonas azerbaijanoccidens]|uniref:DUF72 domain-containing protein n=1 Tax=Pseudomonas azerbaijanoccidentalis TaxID=2842347 RepID=UPI002009F395|nr:DUF72 domain-containing protein [Pseudomonas azerbaijanoccidentalis]MCK8663910.1 DUF72 domain-containing protein [Pseudomonas azerbaijanoccidentalis]